MNIRKLPSDVIRQHKGVSFPGVSTVFFCHDGKGKIFLAKRSKKARDEHGRWDPGAGGLKHGFTLEENIRRELREEYSAVPIEMEFVGYWDALRELDDGTPTHWLAMGFAVLVDPRKVSINEPEMFEDSGWFTLNSLPKPMHSQMEVFLNKHGKKFKKIINDLQP